MGDLLVWLMLGSFVVLIFCIYSLSSQLESRVRLAVEIITGNQRRILEQLETLNSTGSKPNAPTVAPLERRMSQRRRNQTDIGLKEDRRHQLGRRREDFFALDEARNAVLVRSRN